MLLNILLLISAFLLYKTTISILKFRKNLKLAKESGIHYVITPIYWLNRPWLITQRLFFKYLTYLPGRYTEWIDFVLAEGTYDYRHEIFARVGHDTYLTVAAGGNTLFTCDPAVVSQITSRRNDFPKPTKVYRALDIYGGNVVSAEGHQWRQHRKATSPPFTEKNNHLVWSESIAHGTSMLQSWLGPDGKGNVTVDRLMDDTMRVSLFVISGAGFGRKVQWPKEEAGSAHHGHSEHSKIKNEAYDTDPGHKMSWTYALHNLLENLLFQFLFPRWLLVNAPIKALAKAQEAYAEWGAYMQEAVDKRKEEIKNTAGEDVEKDILRQLVKSQMEVKSGPSLTPSEMLGNMFVIILAGHETAANSVHFSILYLALYEDYQKILQKDLEKIFKGRPSQEWEYDRDLPALFGGMAGAVLAEELRLLPPVVNVPKSTIGVPDQTLTVEGRQCTVASDTHIGLATVAAQRNPKYWPHHEPRLPGGHPVHPIANLDNDLEEFNPTRWLVHDEGKATSKTKMQSETVADDGLGVNTSADTSDSLYRPTKGSYFPFSEGHRSCLGRRFAQVEVLALLAVLYQNHSIELDVSKYASDEEVDRMSIDQRAEVWQKAAEDARDLMINGMGVIISLQMRGGTVPVRVVPKGQERFPADVDEIWKRNNPEKCSPKGIPGWKSWKAQLAADSHRKLA